MTTNQSQQQVSLLKLSNKINKLLQPLKKYTDLIIKKNGLVGSKVQKHEWLDQKESND